MKSNNFLKLGLLTLPLCYCAVSLGQNGARPSPPAVGTSTAQDAPDAREELANPPANPPRLVTQLGHAAQITSVAFSRNGRRLLTGSADHTIRLWDTLAGREIRTLVGHENAVTSVAFSYDGKWAVTGSDDNTARVWDIASGQEIRRLVGHTDSVTSVTFSRDGKWILTGSLDGTVRLWDAVTGEKLHQEAHGSGVMSVAFAKNGLFFATGSYDGTARVWDVERGLVSETPAWQRGWNVPVFAENNVMVSACGAAGAIRWNLNSGKKDETARPLNASKSCAWLVACPSKNWLLTAQSDGTARLWDWTTWKEIGRFSDADRRTPAIAISEDGKQVCTGDSNGIAHLWNAETGQEKYLLSGQVGAASAAAIVASDGLMDDGNVESALEIWDWVTSPWSPGAKPTTPLAIGYSPGSKQILTVSRDHKARLWAVNESSNRELSWSRGASEAGELTTSPGHLGPLRCVAFSPDGNQAVTGSDDNTARLWDIETGREKQLFRGHAGSVVAVAFSPDGKYVLTGSLDGSARLWDVETGDMWFSLQGHTGGVISVAFSPDGKQILTGSADRTARLWSIESRETVLNFPKHAAIYAVAFSQDGKQILTGGDDRVLRLWNLPGNVLSKGVDKTVSSLFSVDELKDVGGLLDSLRDTQNPLSNYIRSQFAPDFRNELDAYDISRSPSKLLQKELVEELNHLLQGKLLPTQELFSQVALTAATQKLLAQKPQDEDIIRLNRFLLADAYPMHIAKGRIIELNLTDSQRIGGHERPIRSISVVDDRRVLTASDDGTVRLWSLTGVELKRYVGHTGAVWNVVASPDGQTLVSVGADGTLRLWDLDQGNQLRKVSTSGALGLLGVAIAPNGRFWLAGGLDKTAHLWNAASGQEARPFGVGDAQVGHLAPVTCLAATSDGRLLTGSMDGTARLWDAASGQETHHFLNHGAVVKSVAFGPGTLIVTGAEDGVVRVWDTKKADVVAQILTSTGLKAVDWSRDGQWIFAAGDEGGRLIKVSGTADGTTINEVARLPLTASYTRAVAFSPDSRWLLTGARDGQAKIWEVAQLLQAGRNILEPARRFQEHRLAITCVVWSSDGGGVLTASLDKTVRLWNVATEKRTAIFDVGAESLSVVDAALSADDRTLVIASPGDARVFDIATHREVRRFDAGGRAISAVTFLANGTTCVTAHDDGAARVWDVASGTVMRRCAGPISIEAANSDSPAFAGQKALTALRRAMFSADGKWIIAADGISAQLWNSQGEPSGVRLVGHCDEVTCVALDALGQHALTGSADNTARLWSVADGKVLRELRGHAGPLTEVAFSHDGKRLLTASRDGTARLWDGQNGMEIAQIKSPSGALWSAAFSPDDAQVLVGGETGESLLWNTMTNQVQWHLKASGGGIQGVRFSPSGKYCLTATEDGACHFWNLRAASEKEAEMCTVVRFAGGGWAVVDPGGRYDIGVEASPPNNSGAAPASLTQVSGTQAADDVGERGLHWVLGDSIVDLPQLKSDYFEPGLLDKKLGLSGEGLRVVPRLDSLGPAPEIELLPPAPGESTLRIRLTNKGGGIGRVPVFLDERMILSDASQVASALGGNITATLNVPLGGPLVETGQTYKVRVYANNQKNDCISREASLPWTAPGKKDDSTKPRFFAIVVGISQYAEGAEIVPLRYAASDARHMAEALQTVTRGFLDTPQITLLTSETKPPQGLSADIGHHEATKENLKAAFDDMAAKAHARDVVFIYFAGHGVAVGNNGYCYLTQDAKHAELSNKPLSNWFVSSSEMAEWINRVLSRHIVMVLDTCAAGAFTAHPATETEVSDLPSRAIFSDQQLALDHLNESNGATILMGSAANAVSYESDLYGGGLLTRALLEGMRGPALSNSKTLDVYPWFKYAQNRVFELARGLGGTQKPQIFPKEAENASVPLGLLDETARQGIYLAAAPPQLSLLQLQEKLTGAPDPLKLERYLKDALENVSHQAGGFVLLPAERAVDGFDLAGSYIKENGKLTLTLLLRPKKKKLKFSAPDGVTVEKTKSQILTVSGDPADPEALTKQAAEAVRAAIAKASNAPN